MNQTDNRLIRVFISSTFQDMQDERSELIRKTFPRLREMAAQRDVTLTEVDLRWGITKEESESGKVMEICLREVKNSIPFFIGIIGNRYGWIPAEGDVSEIVKERFPKVPGYVKRQLSATEIEMQFGVLDSKENMNAFFFINDQKDPGDENDPIWLVELKKTRLAELKKAVWENKKYPVSSYTDPEDLATRVLAAFTKLLDNLFPVGELSSLEKERLGQRAVLNNLSRVYIKNEANFALINEWMEDWGKHQLVITGESGMGKSALVANWIKEKLALGDALPYRIIYHFVGYGGSVGSDWHVVKALCDEIRGQYSFDTEDKEPQTDEKALDELFKRVAAEGDKHLLIVLDGVNQIIDVNHAKRLNWLPIPPKKVKILFTTLKDDETMRVFEDQHYPVFTLRPLTRDERIEMVRDYLRKTYSKSLQDVQLERIVDDPQNENTLVLKTLLDEVANFGRFEELDNKIEEFLKPDSISDFYQAVLQNYESDFGEELVRHFLSLIAVSRSGLSEDEILRITETQEKPILWSQFFCSFRQHLIVKNGLITFAHGYIQESVKARYIQGKPVWERSCREEIVLLFEKNDSPRGMDEKPYQLYAMDSFTDLHYWLMHLEHTQYVCDKNPLELASYWKKLICADYALSDYRDILKREPQCKFYISIISLCIEYFSELQAAKELCHDFQALLHKENLLSSKDAEALFIWEGIINRSESNYVKALDCFETALRIIRLNRGDNHLHTSFALKHIGTIYNLTGEYAKAEEYYLKALEIQQNANHKKEAIDTFHSLGDNCLDAKQLDRADYFLNKALLLAIDLMGEESTTVSSLFNSIGALYDDRGDYRQAIAFYNKSISLDNRMLGERHINIAHTYHNLAGTYCRLRQLDKAEDCYQKALQIKIDLYGEENYETATTAAGLGNVKKAKGEYEEAALLHKKYLDAYTQTIGTDSDYLAIILYGIGDDYYLMGNHDTALNYHMQALKVISEKADLIPSQYYNAIGNDLYGMDRFAEAIPYYQKGLDSAIAQSDEYAESVLYYCIGDSYGFLGEFKQAIIMFEKALGIRERILPAGDPRTERCKEKIAQAVAMYARD